MKKTYIITFITRKGKLQQLTFNTLEEVETWEKRCEQKKRDYITNVVYI